MSPRPMQYGLVKPRILERLQMANGGHVSTQNLIDYVWTMNDLEEPLLPENAIAKALQQLRRHGYSIQSKRGPNNPGHRLLPAESGP